MKRIFISSVQKEFADERRLLKRYISKNPAYKRLFDTFVFEEDVVATDRRTDQVYLDELGRCDIYIGLIGNEYGYEDDENRELYYTEYDAAGNQITYAELYTTGTEKGTPRYTYRRTFDSEGNVTEERKYNYKGKPDGLFVYEYAPLSEAIWQG